MNVLRCSSLHPVILSSQAMLKKWRDINILFNTNNLTSISIGRSHMEGDAMIARGWIGLAWVNQAERHLALCVGIKGRAWFDLPAIWRQTFDVQEETHTSLVTQMMNRRGSPQWILWRQRCVRQQDAQLHIGC